MLRQVFRRLRRIPFELQSMLPVYSAAQRPASGVRRKLLLDPVSFSEIDD